LIVSSLVAVLLLAVFISGTSQASAKNSRPRTQVVVFSNLSTQPDGTASITGATYAGVSRCLKARAITLYDESNAPVGSAATHYVRSGGGAGYWEVHPVSGVGFLPGTYHAIAARKRLAHGVVCRPGRSRDTAVTE
jgi:hypothetical protein